MKPTLLDTDIHSEVIKAKHPNVNFNAAKYFAQHGRFSISAITIVEALSGYQRIGRQAEIQQFLQDITGTEVLELDREIAVLAGHIDGDLQRTGQTIGIEDVIIAATAIRYNLILTTGNTKHHLRIVNLGYALQLDNWKTI